MNEAGAFFANITSIRGALQAAQRADAAIIIEIARSECAYCPVNFYNIARQVDAVCNELGITVPVAIHADHYGIKSEADLPFAKTEIPSMFDAGITSIAIDASHMPDDLNLLANIELNSYIPTWAGLETEAGEIKGAEGLSSVEDASFLEIGEHPHEVMVVSGDRVLGEALFNGEVMKKSLQDRFHGR